MAEFEDIFQEKINRHGTQIITNLSILLKITGIYESMNEVIFNTAKRIISEVTPVLEIESEVTIKVSDGLFFIDDTRVKSSLSDMDNFDFLSNEFSKKGIGVLTIKSPLAANDLVTLAYAIKGSKEASEIQANLDSGAVGNIDVGGLLFVKREESLDLSDLSMIATRAYTRALAIMMDINNTIKAGKAINIKKAKRSIQSIIDCILKDESYMLHFIALRNFEDYNLNHSVNVAILSIIIGKRIGLSKYQLSKLGMAGLLHDIGKAELPVALLNKSSEYDKEEIELIRRHPVEGANILVRLSSLSEYSITIMIASYEHHIRYDLKGYPKLPSKRKPGLISKIIFMADQYDALTSGKVYGRTPYSSEKVLKYMHQKSNEYFDPLLVKVFLGA